MPGQVWAVPPGAALADDELGAGAVWVVLGVLEVEGVEDVAALAIAAPPAASEPVTASAAIVVAIRCLIVDPILSSRDHESTRSVSEQHKTDLGSVEELLEACAAAPRRWIATRDARRAGRPDLRPRGP